MKISTGVIGSVLFSHTMLFLLLPLTVFGQSDMVMFPVVVNKGRPLKNVVTVAKANGMFTDPVAAVNSITDATETNPYLVVIAPGIYTVMSPVVMKPHVHIAGSGETVTLITGAIGGNSGVVQGADDSALSSLAIENTADGTTSVALYNNHASPKLTNVTATVSGGSIRVAVYNYSSSPGMAGVTAKARGGAYNYGVFNNEGSAPLMTDSTATGSGPISSTSYGVHNIESAPKIRRSILQGTTDGLNSTKGMTTVSQSTVINGVSGDGNKTCVACDNGYGTALNAYCK